MSDEPATTDLEEATRRSVEAFNRRDWDAAMADYLPDAVWDMSPLGLSEFDGHAAIRSLFEDWWAAFESFEQDMQEFRNLGDGVTFTVIVQRGRPTESSGVVELRYAAVVTWRDGLIERITTYSDIDQARADGERLAQEPG